MFPDLALNQTAVYWGSPSNDGYGGFAYADPVEIDCRWVKSNEVITTSDGRELVSHSQVQVGQDLDEQGMLYLGTLDDLDSDEEDDPASVSGAWKIQRFDKTPTVAGDRFYREAYL